MTQTAFVKHVLRLALDAGWTITAVNDGEELDARSNYTPITAVERATETDEAGIVLKHPEHGKGFLFLVWQGPLATYPYGQEAVADYSLNLDAVVESAYQTAGI